MIALLLTWESAGLFLLFPLPVFTRPPLPPSRPKKLADPTFLGRTTGPASNFPPSARGKEEPTNQSADNIPCSALLPWKLAALYCRIEFIWVKLPSSHCFLLGSYLYFLFPSLLFRRSFFLPLSSTNQSTTVELLSTVEENYFSLINKRQSLFLLSSALSFLLSPSPSDVWQ